MQIVIDIPEEQYITLKAKSQEEVLTVIDISLLIKAIKNGTPLPKGHGRLIDADEAEKVMMNVMCGTGYQSDAMRVLKSDFYTPTIVEADGGDAE